MKKILLTLIAVMASVFSLVKADPVTWSYKLVNDGTDHPSLQMTATIAPGYHLYDFTHQGMENKLAITVTGEGVQTVGAPKGARAPIAEVDEDGANARYFTGSITFTQKLKPTAEKYKVIVKITGQACNDNSCSNYNSAKILEGKAPASAAKADSKDAEAKPGEDVDADAADAALAGSDSAVVADSAAAVAVSDGVGSESQLWANVESQLRELKHEREEESLWAIFLAGILGGLIALITPCVWPMIPMTVSFFLKQNKSRSAGIRSAVIYGLSIVVIYVIIGLLVTAIFGGGALNAMSTNAWFNVFFFILLVVFAISFMGGFEITLPSKWTNKMDSKVDTTTGMVSIFFMAFTLALVSFSCTGPIIGTLLVETATSGNFLSPAVGMLGFAIALALPFTIFAMFPTMLKSMPKSGGWLNSVKVVLGFLELALALKFLSIADLTCDWRILDREVFLCLWIVIFTLLGIYLLGKLRFPHDSKVEKTGIGRFMLALVSLSFALYMVPGLWGAPLKAISAFAPPSRTQDFSLYEGEIHPRSNDYEQGMAIAVQEDKPLLLDFSGHGCTNCRELEGAVWTNDDVRNMINDDFVLVSLMVDERTPLPKPIVKTRANGETVIIETVGELWGLLESEKFGIMAQPYHIILDHNGNPLASPMDYNNGKDPSRYIEFLESGLENYRRQQAQRATAPAK